MIILRSLNQLKIPWQKFNEMFSYKKYSIRLLFKFQITTWSTLLTSTILASRIVSRTRVSVAGCNVHFQIIEKDLEDFTKIIKLRKHSNRKTTICLSLASNLLNHLFCEMGLFSLHNCCFLCSLDVWKLLHLNVVL